MQKHYVHSVPRHQKSIGSKLGRRAVLVLRSGMQRVMNEDSGAACDDNELLPRPNIVYRMGNDFKRLWEGKRYSRARMEIERFHQ